MEDQARHDALPLSLRLELQLDARPITGRLRTDRGSVEEFVGWLGFVEALRRLAEVQSDPKEGLKMIAVMGASGNTGSEISRILLADGEPVRVLGRSRERLAEFEAAGADIAIGDATDAGYLERAFAGADAVYVLMPYDVTHPDYHAQQDALGGAIAEAISRAGVNKVVALSSVGADVAEGTGVVASLHAQEERLRALDGVDVLFLRPGVFYETFYGSLAAAGSLGDVVARDRPLPMTATRDVAAFAARALKSREFSGKVVQELFGPRDLTYVEVAEILGECIGRPGLEYIEMPADEMVESLTQAGFSTDYALQLVAMGEALSDGTIRGHGPRDATLAPTTFERFASDMTRARPPA